MSDTTWPQASIDVPEPVGVLTAEFDGDDVPMEANDSWNRSDVVGIFLSVLCAIHCATMPLLIAALPTLGLSWFEQPWVHQVLFAGCLLLAGNAVLRGYRVHRRPFVPGVAAAGLALLAASAFAFPHLAVLPGQRAVRPRPVYVRSRAARTVRQQRRRQVPPMVVRRRLT